MKQYPSIPYWNNGIFGEPVIAFEKLDGTLIRAEWSKKRGFYKFGTKNMMIDYTHPQFGHAIWLLTEFYSGLADVFKSEYGSVAKFVAFFEFYGSKSFAGLHYPDDPKHITLFDVSQDRRGLIPAKEFIKNFSDYGIPRVVYTGNYNKQLIEDVRKNKFGLEEGVVCKGVQKNRVWMAKIKTNDWLERLKTRSGEEALLQELNNDRTLL